MDTLQTPPLYKVVYDAVLQKIAEGTYPPGSLIPNEFVLAAEFGVSQGTTRKAMSALEQKGVVRRRQGLGTFVTLNTPEDSLFHFFKLRHANGDQVIPELADETVLRRVATEAEQTALFGHPSEVFAIKRLRTLQGAPISLEESIVSTALFPGLDARAPLPNTMYVLFQQAYSCVIISADDNLSAVQIGAKRGKTLGLPPETPALLAYRQSRDILDRVVELRESLYFTETTYYASEIR